MTTTYTLNETQVRTICIAACAQFIRDMEGATGEKLDAGTKAGLGMLAVDRFSGLKVDPFLDLVNKGIVAAGLDEEE